MIYSGEDIKYNFPLWADEAKTEKIDPTTLSDLFVQIINKSNGEVTEKYSLKEKEGYKTIKAEADLSVSLWLDRDVTGLMAKNRFVIELKVVQDALPEEGLPDNKQVSIFRFLQDEIADNLIKEIE